MKQSRREQSGRQLLTRARARRPVAVGAKARSIRRMDVSGKSRRRGSRGRRSASKRGVLQEETTRLGKGVQS
jgi:hypothetical protein